MPFFLSLLVDVCHDFFLYSEFLFFFCFLLDWFNWHFSYFWFKLNYFYRLNIFLLNKYLDAFLLIGQQNKFWPRWLFNTFLLQLYHLSRNRLHGWMCITHWLFNIFFFDNILFFYFLGFFLFFFRSFLSSF